MRSKAKAGLALVVIMAAATSAMAATSIKDSKHDFSSGGAGPIKGNTNQLCVYCHTPHNSYRNVPLWNRSSSTATFTLYSTSNTMENVSNKTGFDPDSVSLFCMSCHDGSTTIGGSIHNAPADQANVALLDAGNVTGDKLGGSGALGADLKNDHPVNFDVTTGTKLKGLDTTAHTLGSGGVKFPLFKNGRGENTLECSSCHSVHDNTNQPFLRETVAGSAICLGCHNK